MSMEETIDQAKDVVIEGVDKVSGDKKLVLISVVSSIVAALFVVAFLEFFFGKKKQFFLDKEYSLKTIFKYLNI